MSDDLVTRIRDLLRADNARDWGPTRDTRLLREAADEIERLTSLYGDVIIGQQEFAARAERAEAERDALLETQRKFGTMMHKLMNERDALRADAERYRWMRKNPTWLGWEHDMLPEQVDKHVDAALREGGK